MPRHTTIPDLARALRDHLLAYVPETDHEVEALKALETELQIALRRAKSRYAIGIDYGLPNAKPTVFRNGVPIIVLSPAIIVEGIRAGHFRHPTFAEVRDNDGLGAVGLTVHPGSFIFASQRIVTSRYPSPHAECAENPCGMCLALRRTLTPAELETRAPSLFGVDITHADDALDQGFPIRNQHVRLTCDQCPHTIEGQSTFMVGTAMKVHVQTAHPAVDELDEEERGEPTAWSSTWDG
jgi:hypothetical protein